MSKSKKIRSLSTSLDSVTTYHNNEIADYIARIRKLEEELSNSEKKYRELERTMFDLVMHGKMIRDAINRMGL